MSVKIIISIGGDGSKALQSIEIPGFEKWAIDTKEKYIDSFQNKIILGSSKCGCGGQPDNG